MRPSSIEAPGFKSQTRSSLIIDLDSALHVDFTLELETKVESVTVSENEIHVEAASAQLGEVITGKSMTAVA
jgi:hypothetical protein